METKSIGEVSQVNLSQIRRTHEGPISYIDTSSVIYGKFSFPKIYSSVQDAPSRARRLAKSGDTVISTVRPKMCHYGYISSVNEKDIFSTGFVVVHPRRQVIEPYYLYLVLTSDEVTEKLQQIAETSTTTYPSIKPSDITSIDIIIPSRKYQQDVAGIIGAIDEKIVLNQQINKNLQKLKDDIWISQRVDKKTSLSNLMTIQSGKRPIDRYDNKFRLKELYPIIGANGVMGWTSKALTAGTIITTGRVGTHGVVNMFDEPVWVSDNSFIISSKYEEVAYEILRCDVKFLTLVHGTTQPLITQKDLKQYVVSIPSNNQLKKVNEHLKVYTNLINVNNKQNKFLTALRNLLLPKLLSGEIDLSDVKEVIQGD